MPGGAEDTRQALIDAACRAFAEHGVHTASLLEITRQAGQRNRGAVHYHFGSREGMLAAVLEQHADSIGQRELQLLAVARERPDDDVASVIEALVRPVTETAESGWRERCYIVIIGELVQQDITPLGPDVEAALARTGGYELFDLLRQRLAPLGMDEALENERLALMTAFVLRSVADRARSGEMPPSGREELPTERFICNLVGMATAMLTAPLP